MTTTSAPEGAPVSPAAADAANNAAPSFLSARGTREADACLTLPQQHCCHKAGNLPTSLSEFPTPLPEATRHAS